MSSVVNDRAIGERRILNRRMEDRAAVGVSLMDGLRVSWGGVWAGLLVAMAVLILLGSLGLAVGASAVDPQQPAAQALGTGAAIWGGVSLLIALFIGGMVSTRVGMVHDRTAGAWEGALVWVMSILAIAYLATSGIGLVAGGAFKLVGGAAQTIGSVVQGNPDAASLSQGSVDQMVQRLNDPSTARTLSAAIGVPQDQVQQDLSGIAQRVEQNRNNPTQAAAQVKQGVQQIIDQARAQGSTQRAAQRVKSAASITAWVTFIALVLSLLAAVWGSMLGRRRAAVVSGRERP